MKIQNFATPRGPARRFWRHGHHYRRRRRPVRRSWGIRGTPIFFESFGTTKSNFGFWCRQRIRKQNITKIVKKQFGKISDRWSFPRIFFKILVIWEPILVHKMGNWYRSSKFWKNLGKAFEGPQYWDKLKENYCTYSTFWWNRKVMIKPPWRNFDFLS